MAATVWAAARTGFITGTLLAKDGASLGGGKVFLFNAASGPPPSPEKYWRVPDEVIPIEANGGFTAEIPPGTYYLGAIKPLNEKGQIRPPHEGDLVYFGSHRRYVVKSGQTIKLGTVRGAVPFVPPSGTVAGLTTITGVVVDEAGKPVNGALVFAYLSPNMVGKPLFVSEKAGADGRFVLRVDGSGSYFLKARDIYAGGAPNVGSFIGTYGEKTPVAVVTRAGSSTGGITIKVVEFAGRGPGANRSGPPPR